MTNALTILEPQNMAQLTQTAPQALRENIASRDRCLQYGQTLLDRAASEGMSDGLDQEIATFIDRSKATLRKMNGKRAAITQLFDTIRSAYTSLENDVDPAKRDTVPARLQGLRNEYAAKKREELERKRREMEARQARQQARARYAGEIESDLTEQYNTLAAAACDRLVGQDNSVTLDNYETVYDAVKSAPDALPAGWFDGLRARVQRPAVLTAAEAEDIERAVRQSLLARFTEQYAFEVSSTRDDILDRLPSKRKELERMAAADTGEAARIRERMEERERAEAARREQERAEREAKEKAGAGMGDLFDSAKASLDTRADYQPKAQVRRKITLLSPEGMVAVIGMWWSQVGCTLAIDELEKTFSKQLTYCNRLANDKDNPVLIKSEHIQYVDDIKAK